MINLYKIIKESVPAKLHEYLQFVEDDEQGTTVRFLKPGHKGKGPKMSQKNNYFRVVTGEKEGRAEMFLYGFIGQDFWWDEEMKEESITDISFIRSFRELEKQYDRIDIRINSPGGSVMHGDPIIAAIRASKSEIHTYVDGIAASMAADIWMAGHTRHMGVNSKLMIHSTWSVAVGNAKDMRAAADQLEKFDSAAIATFSKATGWTEEETKERFYDHEDHWLTAKDVEELGLIERVEDYQTDEPGSDTEKASYQELVKGFSEKIHEEEKPREGSEVDKTKEDENLMGLITIDLDGNIQEQVQEKLGENFSVSIEPTEEKNKEENEQEKHESDFLKTDTDSFLKKRKLNIV